MMVNEIANRAFLIAASNIPLSNTEPQAYLPVIACVSSEPPRAISSRDQTIGRRPAT